MKQFRIGAVLTVLAAMCLAATGCNDPKQLEIDGLKTKVATDERQISDLRGMLNQAEVANTDLRNQLAQKDALLASHPGTGTSTDIARTGTSGEGWEVGLAGDRLTLDSDILFAPGKADLTAPGKAKLDKAAVDIKTHYTGLPIRVYGYTDVDPIRKTKNLWADNLDLSANRAMAVTRYLSSKGVKPANIETVAMGEWHPASSKQKSRRVELIVVKKPSGVTGPGTLP